MRTILNFNGNWIFTKPGCAPEAVTLPHTWNAVDSQDGGNDYFRGFCTYEKTFARPEGEVVYLEFPGAAMTADVTVNGQKLCYHEGGFSAFRVDMQSNTNHTQYPSRRCSYNFLYRVSMKPFHQQDTAYTR